MASQAVGTPEIAGDVQLRILNALDATSYDNDSGRYLPLAYTRQALGAAIGVPFPELAVPLRQLLTAGKITTRVHRPSGRTLYKLRPA